MKVNKKGIIISIVTLLILVLSFGVYNYLLLPELVLKGEKEVTLNYKEKYKEEGFKAKYFDDNLTDKVKVSGTVDSNKLGKYYITYKVSNGMFTREVNRVVNVVDNKKPVFSMNDKTLKNKDILVCPGKKYKKEEVKVFDNYDGDITKKVSYEFKDNKAIYSIVDSNGNSNKLIYNIIEKDDIKPNIVLNGQDIVYSFLNEEYVEPGFVATDNCLGDITKRVKVDGNVDNSKSGEYILTYSVTDDFNNTFSKTRKIIVSERGKNGTIYLTFDDGPREGTTNVILDVLKEENVKATFFVTNNGPDYLLKRAYDEGHTIALHTATHDYQTVYASVDSYFNDLYSVRDRVKRVTGYDSKIIRFPGGSSNTISRRYSEGIMTTLTQEVMNRGYKYYDWNVSSGDASGGRITKDFVYNNVKNGVKKDRVNMVLLHDIKYATRDAVRDIIRFGKENGYAFEKITDDTEMITQRVNN